MNTEKRIQNSAELRVEDRNGSPVIVGYAALYNSRSLDLGGFTETIKPGAFARAISEKQDVRALVDHDASAILGRSTAGTLRIAEDERGLRVEIDVPDTQVGRDIVTSIRRGDVTGMSFGFRTVKDNWLKEDRKALRELIDVDLLDVSPVTFPAYPETSVAVRSLAAWQEAEPQKISLDTLAAIQRHKEALSR